MNHVKQLGAKLAEMRDMLDKQDKERNPHFDSVAAAQARRMTRAMRLTDAEIKAAFEERGPNEAYELAKEMLGRAVQRGMIAAHERSVD
jgi:peptidoglycan hydrolase CwlO-like protein